MSMSPDLEKQQPPKDSRRRIVEYSDDCLQTEYPVNPLPHGQGPQRFGDTAKRAQPVRKTFGMKKSTNDSLPDPVTANQRDEHSAKQKTDVMFHEAGVSARVWQVYNREAAISDADMLEEASDSLDILLVFAGLFASVLTTFLIQTSQSLAPDTSALSVALLRELVDLQRAQAMGVSFDTVPQAASRGPSSNDKWVNGLWFTSLSLSLSSALIAVLVKQWLRQYRSHTSGFATASPQARALRRQFRYNNFKAWHVRSIIGLLPTVLHTALFLFLVGLVLFLIPLNTTIAVVIGVITFILLATYIITLALPVIIIHCPYRTPISHLIYRLFPRQNPITKRPCETLKSWENYHITWRWKNSAHEALLWLFQATSNPSFRASFAKTFMALWSSDYRKHGVHRDLGFPRADFNASGADSHSTLREFVSRTLFPDVDSIESFWETSTELESDDWTRLSPEQTRRLQYGLLYPVVYGNSNNKDQRVFARMEALANKEFKVWSCDPSLGLLALSCGFNVRFLGDKDGESAHNDWPVSSKHAFSWLLENHRELAMPELHPAVWESIQAREERSVQEILQESPTVEGYLRDPITKSSDSFTAMEPVHLHQPMSFELFMREQGSKFLPDCPFNLGVDRQGKCTA